MYVEISQISADWMWYFLPFIPILFGWPVGGRKRCKKCHGYIPDTDEFWDFDFRPFCENCLQTLTAKEYGEYEDQQRKHNNFLCEILKYFGVKTTPEKAAGKAKTVFVEAVVSSKMKKVEES